MSLAARFAARAFHRSSAGAVAKTALVARHRFISSGSTAPANKGGGTKACSPAVTVEITETMPGGGKTEQDAVKLDICGEIEGGFVLLWSLLLLLNISRRQRWSSYDLSYHETATTAAVSIHLDQLLATVQQRQVSRAACEGVPECYSSDV